MASLDMSLDDMIKSRKSTVKGGRGQGRPRRGRGGPGGPSRGGRTPFGAPRRNPLGLNARPSAHSIAKASSMSYALHRQISYDVLFHLTPSWIFDDTYFIFKSGKYIFRSCADIYFHFEYVLVCLHQSFRRTKNLPWHSGLVEESLKSVGLSGLEAGTKLFISNLDVGVSNEDIRKTSAQELFSEIGELIRYAIHFDKNGRPSGSAEVVFARLSDAFQALKRYNNVQLDGKPMKIEIVGANAGIPMSARVNVVGGANGKKRTVVMAFLLCSLGLDLLVQEVVLHRQIVALGKLPVDSSFLGCLILQRGRGGLNTGRGGGGRGGGRGRGGAQWRKKVEKSADDLDKELDSYHAEAMQS
ncbi:hypothetical protein SASPL_146936 [Salvia splendens]|uniref:RRM domain-containing protein n=1 Tax=Salvia splendens TaxID=180675 RepID=A0A8X8Z5D3_SALSN|nr:hypothetical protein SASPL_146936 [Salvia splendens]